MFRFVETFHHFFAFCLSVFWILLVKHQYSFIEELSANDKRIRCFNYLDQKKNYKASIKNSKDKLFVIDNADILLDDKMRHYIAFDAQNQYVIIGRNPTGLMLELDEIYELSSENINGRTLLSLKKSF